MSQTEGSSIQPQKYEGKYPMINDLSGKDTETKMKIPKSRDIDAPFDLEEDLDRPLEKYGDEFDVSDDENDDDDGVQEAKEESYKSSKVVPHSMPMNINFGVDPFTQKVRTPLEKAEEQVDIPNGSIYENMQILSRSIQSSDYRNRLWGTKPEDARDTYSQSYQYHGSSRPRGIICSKPAQRVNISEETLEESPSLETPK